MLGFEITEEREYLCENNMGESMPIPYRADLYCKLEFNLELDPHQGHTNSKHNINKDQWKDINIFQKYKVKTVRINPKDVNKRYNLFSLFNEITDQLEDEDRFKVNKNKK